MYKNRKLLARVAFLILIAITYAFVLGNYSNTFAATTCGFEKISATGVDFCAHGIPDGMLSRVTRNGQYYDFRVKCTKNCSTNIIADAIGQLFAGQTIYLDGLSYKVQAPDGTWTVCFNAEGFSADVYEVYDRCVNPQWQEKVAPYLECTAAVTGVGAVGIITGAGAVPVGLKVATACGISQGALNAIESFKSDFNNCYPQFQIDVEKWSVGSNGLGISEIMCSTDITYDVQYQIDSNIPPQQDPPGGSSGTAPPPGQTDSFSFCSQINDPTLKQECIDCAGGEKGYEGVWTAIGCIRREPEAIVRKFMVVGISMGGGVALLTFLAAGFILSTSQGNTQQIDQAKQMLTASISGLLFIIFSVGILEYIGYSILGIPGFGG